MKAKGEHRPNKLIPLEDFKSWINEYLDDCRVKQIAPLMGEFGLDHNISGDSMTAYSNRPGYAALIKDLKLQSEMVWTRKVEKTGNIGPMFLLKAVHGYSDRQSVDITTNGKPLGVVELPPRKPR